MKFLGLTFRWVLSTLFILLGSLYVLLGFGIVVSGAKSKSWPTVVGTVVSSAVVEHRAKGVSYSPEVRYEYRVGSASYENRSIWLLDYAAGEERARKVVAQFQPQSSVVVFYEPSSPARSILKPGTNWFMFATSGIGLVVLVVGTILSPAWALFRKNEERPNNKGCCEVGAIAETSSAPLVEQARSDG